jgi:hypothetical protein
VIAIWKRSRLFLLLCLSSGFISNCRNADHSALSHSAPGNFTQPTGTKNPPEKRFNQPAPTGQSKNPLDSERKVIPLGGNFAVEIRPLTPPGQSEWERDPKAIVEEIVEDLKKSLPLPVTPEKD